MLRLVNFVSGNGKKRTICLEAVTAPHFAGKCKCLGTNVGLGSEKGAALSVCVCMLLLCDTLHLKGST